MSVAPAIQSVLVHIQTHLDGTLTLDALAARAGFSVSHFHRLFRAHTGETVKQYVQRLRLERGALRLCLHETTVLDTALEVGFHNHETFTRAFRKRFGVAPQEVLRGGVAALCPSVSRSPSGRGRSLGQTGELSTTSLGTLKPMHLAFIRHLGPYEQVGSSIWRELESWAEGRSLGLPRTFVGVGHDAPGITPPDKLRFDAALHVDRAFRPTGVVGYQLLSSRLYALTTHVGPYSTLPDAYSRLLRRIERLKGIDPAGLPVVEMYRETRIDVDRRLNHTDLYLPVRRRGAG